MKHPFKKRIARGVRESFLNPIGKGECSDSSEKEKAQKTRLRGGKRTSRTSFREGSGKSSKRNSLQRWVNEKGGRGRSIVLGEREKEKDHFQGKGGMGGEKRLILLSLGRSRNESGVPSRGKSPPSFHRKKKIPGGGGFYRELKGEGGILKPTSLKGGGGINPYYLWKRIEGGRSSIQKCLDPGDAVRKEGKKKSLIGVRVRRGEVSRKK